MVDRRQAPGGHWLEAYPFVRLHQPSAYYGVNSLALGSETIDRHGPNAGMYERAGAAEICGYYDRVMQQRLLPSGQVRYFPMSSYLGEHRFVSGLSGDEYEVKVRKKLVDATYLEGRVPASSPPPFEAAPAVRCIPIGALANVRERPEGYVVIGAGKTALDACTWLLDGGVSPDDICWIKPREGWFINRHYMQGGDLVGTMFEGLSLQLEAAARATSTADLFGRLEASRQLLRVDPHVAPTMFRGPTVSPGEVDQLRRIEGVVRLGKVRRIEPDRNRARRRHYPDQPAAPTRALRGRGPEPRPRDADLQRRSNHAAVDTNSDCSRSRRLSSRSSRRRATTSMRRTASVRPTASRTCRLTGCAGCSSA